MRSSFYTLKGAMETHRKLCVLKYYLHIKMVYICKKHVFGKGRWQAYRINSSGDGRHPARDKKWKKTVNSRRDFGGEHSPCSNLLQEGFELMPPNGEWEPLHQKRGLKSGVSSGELGGGSPLGPLWKVWWRQKVKVEKRKWRTKVFPTKRSILIHGQFYCSNCQTL